MLDAIAEVHAVNAVAITKQKAWRLIEWECLHDLLSRPMGSRVGRDVDVNDAGSVVSKNDEAIEQTGRRPRNHGEVDCGDIGYVILKECPQSL